MKRVLVSQKTDVIIGTSESRAANHTTLAPGVGKKNIVSGDVVDIFSHASDGIRRAAKGFKAIPYNIPEGCAAAYFPEANVLVPLNSVADKSHTPTSKFIEIEIERVIVK